MMVATTIFYRLPRRAIYFVEGTGRGGGGGEGRGGGGVSLFEVRLRISL